MAAALVSVALDIVLALVLAPTLGLPGVAAAIAIGAWVETAILAVLLERRIHRLGLGGVARAFLAAALVTVAAVVVAWLAERTLVDAWGPAPGVLGLLVRVALVSTVGGLVVVAGALALRIPELPAILEVVTDLVRRRGRS